MSLDTEGSEYEILKGFDFKNYTVGLIDIEHNYEEPRRSYIKNYLETYGYVRYHENKWDDSYIHNSLLTNESRLALQLDFTATPKHKDSSIFVQTVSDYPLTEAIHQNIVKNIEVPKKLYMDDFKIYPSTKYSEK